MPLIFLLSSVFIINTAIASVTDTIGFQQLTTITKSGGLPVSRSEVIRNTEQLTTYLSLISSDISAIPVMPDFNFKTVIALGYNRSLKSYSVSQTVVKILSGDTVMILFHADSQSVDSTIHIQQAYNVQLFTIAKTSKPVIAKNESDTAVVAIKKYILQKKPVQHIPNRTFDLKGRPLSSKVRNGLSVFTGSCGTKQIIDIR